MIGTKMSDSVKAYFALCKRALEWKRKVAEYRDAAEFEARVAKRLTGGLWIFGFCSQNCPWNRMDPNDSFSCVDEKRGMRFCRLRDARCWVEKEMDG